MANGRAVPYDYAIDSRSLCASFVSFLALLGSCANLTWLGGFWLFLCIRALLCLALALGLGIRSLSSSSACCIFLRLMEIFCLT